MSQATVDRAVGILEAVQVALSKLINEAAIKDRLSSDAEAPNRYILRLVAFAISVDRDSSYEERELFKAMCGREATHDLKKHIRSLIDAAPSRFLSEPPEFIRELIAADGRNGTLHSIRALQLIHLAVDSAVAVDARETAAEEHIVAGVPAAIAEAIVAAGLCDRPTTMRLLVGTPSPGQLLP